MNLNISDFYRNDQIGLRHLILYEYIGGSAAYRAYQNLCGRIGDDVIDYAEFEFWYMRFARGELNMNYDRSLEPKTRSFSDLPVDVIEIIGKELNFSDRLIVRHVSKFFKQIADNWMPRFKSASINVDYMSTVLTLDESRYEYSNGLVPFKYRNHWKLALSHLLAMLKKSEDRLDKLCFNYSFYNKISDDLEAKIKLTAKDLKIKTPIVEIVTNDSCGELAILPLLEPETLKEITIDMNVYINQTAFENKIKRIAKLQQCQQSKTFTIKISSYQPPSFPIKHFLKFTNLSLHFRSEIPISDVLRFIRVLSRSTSLKYFHLTSSCDLTINKLKKRLGKNALEVPDRPDVRHFRIPKTEEAYFELDLSLSRDYSIDLTIKRMS